MNDDASTANASRDAASVPNDDELYGPDKLGAEFWDRAEGLAVRAGRERVRLAVDPEVLKHFKAQDGDYRELMADALHEHVARATDRKAREAAE